LNSPEFVNEVRQEKTAYTNAGINSVPSIILNDQYLLQGAQPAESFVEAFEQLMQKS
jgi:predicted DsbA family dithiol-disulfide isomerase